MYPFPESKKQDVEDWIYCMGYCANQTIKHAEEGNFEQAERFKNDMEFYYQKLKAAHHETKIRKVVCNG